MLLYVLTETLKLLHPFMPFITEEIYQALPHQGTALMVQPYPGWRAELDFAQEEASFEEVMEMIRAIRSRRSEMNVPPARKTRLFIVTDDGGAFEAGRDYLRASGVCQRGYRQPSGSRRGGGDGRGGDPQRPVLHAHERAGGSGSGAGAPEPGD